MPLLLLSIGGGNIKSVAAGEATTSLNNTMISAATVVGAIVILVAIVKLIMALAEQNAATKQQASLMFAVGIVFLSMSTIIKMLGIDGTTVPETKTVAENIINIIVFDIKFFQIIRETFPKKINEIFVAIEKIISFFNEIIIEFILAFV